MLSTWPIKTIPHMADQTSGAITIHPSDKKQMQVSLKWQNGWNMCTVCGITYHVLLWKKYSCLYNLHETTPYFIYDFFKQPWLVTIIIILTKRLHHASKLLSSSQLPALFLMYTKAVGGADVVGELASQEINSANQTKWKQK